MTKEMPPNPVVIARAEQTDGLESLLTSVGIEFNLLPHLSIKAEMTSRAQGDYCVDVFTGWELIVDVEPGYRMDDVFVFIRGIFAGAGNLHNVTVKDPKR